MRIMLVDDSRTMRNIQKKVLDSLGTVEYAEAGDGVEALALLAQNPPPFDFILVDWNMPNMDGLTLIQKIREKDKKTPLIMATTEAEKSRVLEAIRAGVNNYVVKPFTPEALMEKIKQTLDKVKAAQSQAKAA
jgi:two-component system, chemotaxis family, chemotaxis protein CheY